jgi:DNA replication and repair protein RecF
MASRHPAPADTLTQANQYWLRTLEVRDFRNLARVALTLPPSGLVVVGDNGQGKTNLLEAIAYLHLLRSVRAARDIDVVRFGAAGFSVRGEAGTHTVLIGFERATRRKRVTVDGAVPERLSDALGTVPSVTFSPVDLDLVRGAPGGRRRYLDVVLATTSRRYLAALQQYRAALIRRNAALRTLARRTSVAKAALDAALVAWEPLLADAGAVLWAERAAWAHEWGDELARVCAAIGEREAVRMRYVARLPGSQLASAPLTHTELCEALTATLEEGRVGDLRHGSTRTGPHRDDLLLMLGERELRLYGSAGQQRTVAIGLRILEAAALRGRGGATPVLLFDDPFAELDERRARAILDVLAGPEGGTGRGEEPLAGQVILAVPRPADIPPGLTRLSRVRIADGQVTGVD